MTMNLQNADDFMNAIKNAPETFTREIIREIAGNDEWLLNCAMNTYEYVHQCELTTTFPLDVVLPMTCWCNASCRFCRYCQNENFYLKPDDLARYDVLLKHAKNYGFSSYGEPLVHPFFDQYAQAVKALIDPRATTYLVTNGIFLHRHLDTVKKYCNSVSISLNAASAKIHSETMRADKGAFNRIIESVEDLIRFKEVYNDKLNIQLSFAVVYTNLHEIPEFIKLAQRLRVNKVNFNTLNLTKKEDFTDKTNVSFFEYQGLHPVCHPDFYQLKKNAVAALQEAKVDYQANPEAWGLPSIYRESHRCKCSGESEITYHCPYLYQKILIPDADETIRPCCFMKAPPDSLSVRYNDSSDFLTGWNSNGFKALRSALAKGQLPQACRMCTMYEENISREKK
jgi:MoaA/NifB/PqqE/SkfB family radical SAM enzyme